MIDDEITSKNETRRKMNQENSSLLKEKEFLEKIANEIKNIDSGRYVIEIDQDIDPSASVGITVYDRNETVDRNPDDIFITTLVKDFSGKFIVNILLLGNLSGLRLVTNDENEVATAIISQLTLNNEAYRKELL